MNALYKIEVCKGRTCRNRFSDEVHSKFEQLIKDKNIITQVSVNRGGCYGRCQEGPNSCIISSDVSRGPTFYSAGMQQVEHILNEHILKDPLIKN